MAVRIKLPRSIRDAVGGGAGPLGRPAAGEPAQPAAPGGSGGPAGPVGPARAAASEGPPGHVGPAGAEASEGSPGPAGPGGPGAPAGQREPVGGSEPATATPPPAPATPPPTPATPPPTPATPPPATPAPADAPATGRSAGAPSGSAIGQVLPMYFVGDESHSMAGGPIEAVNQGLLDLRDEVAKHPLIGKKVRFGIITFADTAETRLELSELSEDLVLPTLSPRGRGTNYASALEALRQSIPADIALLKSSGYQVHRPSVFFLSDGQPTEKEEKWRTRLEELKDASFRERPNILAFGVGDADPQVIRQLATAPRYGFMMSEGASTAGAIAEFAASMLNSMVASAERLERGEQTIEFEKPEGFVQLDAPLV
jgi:uncharacterized protein YegL